MEQKKIEHKKLIDQVDMGLATSMGILSATHEFVISPTFLDRKSDIIWTIDGMKKVRSNLKYCIDQSELIQQAME